MSIEKKVAVVTGSYKGLGFEIARQLAQVGNIQVVISSRDEAKGKDALKTLEQEGLDVGYLPLDVTDEKSVEDFVSALRNQYARADILINNAGVNPSAQTEENSVLSAKLDTVISTFSVNVVASLRICQALIPIMQDRSYGRIVNVSTEMASLNYIASDFYPISPS